MAFPFKSDAVAYPAGTTLLAQVQAAGSVLRLLEGTSAARTMIRGVPLTGKVTSQENLEQINLVQLELSKVFQNPQKNLGLLGDLNEAEQGAKRACRSGTSIYPPHGQA